MRLQNHLTVFRKAKNQIDPTNRDDLLRISTSWILRPSFQAEIFTCILLLVNQLLRVIQQNTILVPHRS